MALIEKELAGGEAREAGLGGKVRGEGAEIAGAFAAFSAGESDVGMVGTVFGLETAGNGGGHDALLEREKRGCGLDAEVEDARARKDARRGELDGELRAGELGEMGEQAGILLGGGGAEKLEGDVPGHGCGPMEARRVRAQTGSEAGEPGVEGFVEREGEEETHGGSVCKAAALAGLAEPAESVSR
jgi:hypothetical protein